MAEEALKQLGTILKLLLAPLNFLLRYLLPIVSVYFAGRSSGANAEKERSKKVVKKTQRAMDKETKKPVTNKEVQDRLKDGTF